jgi:hypothetical protein
MERMAMAVCEGQGHGPTECSSFGCCVYDDKDKECSASSSMEKICNTEAIERGKFERPDLLYSLIADNSTGMSLNFSHAYMDSNSSLALAPKPEDKQGFISWLFSGVLHLIKLAMMLLTLVFVVALVAGGDRPGSVRGKMKELMVVRAFGYMLVVLCRFCRCLLYIARAMCDQCVICYIASRDLSESPIIHTYTDIP